MKTKKDEYSGYFWKSSEGMKRITILNPDDFTLPSFAGLSVNRKDFGLCDLYEITRRNEITEFLFKNPNISKKIVEWSKQIQFKCLPNDENNFLEFYSRKENSYWQLVGEVISELEKIHKLPKRIENFLKKIKDEKDQLMTPEKLMSGRITDQLSKATKIDGFFELDVREGDINHENSAIIGEKAWSSKWSAGYEAYINSFWKTKFCRFVFLRALVQKIANKIAKESAKKSSLIQHFPTSLKDDVFYGLRSMIETSKVTVDSLDEDREVIAERLSNEISKMKHTYIGIKFYYNDNGLFITPYYIRRESEYYNQDSTFFNTYKNWESKKQFIKKAEIYNEKNQNALQMKTGQEVVNFFEEFSNFKIGVCKKVSSNLTDSAFKWMFLGNVYNHKDNVKVFEKLEEQRKEFFSSLKELSWLVGVIDDYKDYAKNNKLPICIPTIKESGMGISFKKLAPIDMISQNKKMISFTFPTINGHMVCLTGRHGGGKSVSGNSVLQSLYLAQSGLPVFAEKFEFDIKDVIGSVTNDKGKGSTATIFVQKTKNLFKNISKVPAEKSLIFIDEIGKGTQEDAGFELGRKILEFINKNGYSAIFNTQNMNLAKFAQDNFNAICLKANKKHQFSPGIGEGEMSQLIKEIGLDKYLN